MPDVDTAPKSESKWPKPKANMTRGQSVLKSVFRSLAHTLEAAEESPSLSQNRKECVVTKTANYPDCQREGKMNSLHPRTTQHEVPNSVLISASPCLPSSRFICQHSPRKIRQTMTFKCVSERHPSDTERRGKERKHIQRIKLSPSLQFFFIDNFSCSCMDMSRKLLLE